MRAAPIPGGPAYPSGQEAGRRIRSTSEPYDLGTRLGSDMRGRFQGGTRVSLPGILGIVLVVAVVTLHGFPPARADAARAATNPSNSVDGVPLIPITASQRAACQRFADQLKRPVPCPGLLPDPIPVSPTSSAASCLSVLGEDGCGPAKIQESGGVFFLSQSNFQVPAGYVGVTFEQNNGAVVPETSVSGGPLGHFVFMAGRDLQSYLRNEPGERTYRRAHVLLPDEGRRGNTGTRCDRNAV